MRLVDADALIKRLNKIGAPYRADINNAIVEAPTIDAKPVRHGKWKCMGDCGVTECGQCGWSIEEYVGDYNYCPNCGTRMDKE